MIFTITELLTGIAIVGAAYWAVFHLVYKSRLDTRDEKIAERDEKIRELQRQLDTEKADKSQSLSIVVPRLDTEEQPPYYPRWEHVPRYTLWQAAWLWIGKEPTRNIAEGCEAYPILTMLMNHAISEGWLRDKDRLVPESSVEVTQEHKVSREDLQFFAEKVMEERPAFLFSEDNPTIDDLLK